MIGKGLDLPLLEWLNKYTFKCEAKFACNDHAKKVYTRSVKAHLSHGTTTICYFGSIHLEATQILADCMATAGMRGFVGKTCMDCNSPDYYRDVSAKTAIEDTKALIKYIEKSGYNLVGPVITPRFAPTCSRELMSGLGAVAKTSKSLIQTHLSENKDEIKWVSSLFPESSSYTDVYDRHGLLNDKTVLAHCIYLDQKELALIAKKGAGIAHCPNSNITIQSGIMPTREYLDYSKGYLKIGLGTDVSGGYSLSILDSIKQCIGLSKVAPSNPVTLP
jgi:guanine deaminase